MGIARGRTLRSGDWGNIDGVFLHTVSSLHDLSYEHFLLIGPLYPGSMLS